MTTRYDQAKHMAITDPYWRAYIDGLDDKHNIRDNTRDAEHEEARRLLQARLDRIANAADLSSQYRG